MFGDRAIAVASTKLSDTRSIQLSNPGKPGCGVAWNPESTIQNLESSDIVEGYRGECRGIMRKMDNE